MDTSQLVRLINTGLNSLKGITTQVFRLVEGIPEQVGSAFYLRYEDRIFLTSAAHVFDDPPLNERWVFDETGELQPIRGRCWKHVFTGNRDNDIKDIIVIEINGLSLHQAYNGAALDRSQLYRRGMYAFMGFPATKNGKCYKQRHMKNRPYAYWDKSLEAKAITSFAYDDHLNVIIRYQHRDVVSNNEKIAQRGAKMKGISGGPVFWLGPLHNLSAWTAGRIQLAGIVIHTVERHQYMAGVRIRMATDVIDGSSGLSNEFEQLQL